MKFNPNLLYFMKQFIAAIACIVFFNVEPYAQIGIPATGIVEIAKLQTTTVEFDKAAESDGLCDAADHFNNPELPIEITRRSSEVEWLVQLKYKIALSFT